MFWLGPAVGAGLILARGLAKDKSWERDERGTEEGREVFQQLRRLLMASRR